MNYLKSATRSLAIVMLIIITGCGDNFIAPTSTGNKSNDQRQVSLYEESEPANYYSVNVEIKPGETFSLSRSNTNYYSFNSISISDCNIVSYGLEVIGYSDDELIILDCMSKGFDVSMISVRNVSAKAVSLNIKVTGTKKKIFPRDPVDADQR